MIRLLCEFDGPNLSGPIVHVLKEVVVNGAEVRQIEVAGGNAMCGTFGHKKLFFVVELFRVPDVEFIS
jgi:hypothetical protein